MEGDTENLTLPASKAHIPREGQRCPAGRTLGFGWSIFASLDFPEWAGKKEKTSPAGMSSMGGAVTKERLRARAGACAGETQRSRGRGQSLPARGRAEALAVVSGSQRLQGLVEMRPTGVQGHWIILQRRKIAQPDLAWNISCYLEWFVSRPEGVRKRPDFS